LGEGESEPSLIWAPGRGGGKKTAKDEPEIIEEWPKESEPGRHSVESRRVDSFKGTGVSFLGKTSPPTGL